MKEKERARESERERAGARGVGERERRRKYKRPKKLTHFFSLSLFSSNLSTPSRSLSFRRPFPGEKENVTEGQCIVEDLATKLSRIACMENELLRAAGKGGCPHPEPNKCVVRASKYKVFCL